MLEYLGTVSPAQDWQLRVSMSTLTSAFTPERASYIILFEVELVSFFVVE